jgi:hypothetical protein
MWPGVGLVEISVSKPRRDLSRLLGDPRFSFSVSADRSLVTQLANGSNVMESLLEVSFLEGH